MTINSKEKLTPTDRRAKIIKLIYARRIVTMNDLAEELGVAVRTIKRDIDHLTLSHPLETIRGRYGGGVKIIDDFNLRNKHLNTEEIELLEELKECLPVRKSVIIENILNKFALCR